jgi:hypothetical protein
MITIDAVVEAGSILHPAKPLPAGGLMSLFDGARYMVAETAEDVATLTAMLPPSAPAYAPMEKLAFLAHFTDDQIASALGKPGLAVFWVKFNAAGYLERDNPLTTAGLAALVAEKVIPQSAADELMANWPTA